MSAAKLEKAPKADKSAVKADKSEKPVKTAKVKKAKVVDIKDAPKKVASAEKLINTLLAPHITEKTSLAMQNNNSYAFRVLRESSKPEIKAAVELMFKVQVEGIQTLNVRGKETKRSGRAVGHRRSWKKAFVSLKEGQEISFAPGDSK